MVNFPNELELFNMFYTKDKTNDQIQIATTQIRSHNATTTMLYDKNSNLFSEDRINASISLINGNGTATFELKNLQYDEDGVFTLKSIVKVEDEFGITVKVQGKLIR